MWWWIYQLCIFVLLKYVMKNFSTYLCISKLSQLMKSLLIHFFLNWLIILWFFCFNVFLIIISFCIWIEIWCIISIIVNIIYTMTNIYLYFLFYVKDVCYDVNKNKHGDKFWWNSFEFEFISIHDIKNIWI